MISRIERETAAAYDTMRAGGATIIDFSPAEQAKWAATLPNIAERWAAPLEAKGLPARNVLRQYVDLLKKGGATPARDWTQP